jgi:hypothetical protein
LIDDLLLEMKDKEIQNIIFELGKRAKTKDRKCLFDGCPNLAIESHLLQENGILDSIKDTTNHLWKLKINEFKGDFYFDSIGINKAFAFKGFCNPHDNDLFKSIETKPIDFNRYNNHIRFSYRTLLNEKRKKEIWMDKNTRILNSTNLQYHLPNDYISRIKNELVQNEFALNDGRFYEEKLLSNIFDTGLKDYIFITVELPKVEFCSSAVFTFETSDELFRKYSLHQSLINKPPTNIFLHLFPVENNSILIIGCLKERIDVCWDFIEKFEKVSNEECLKKLSNLFLCNIENWICSYSFYQNNILKRQDEIYRLIKLSRSTTNERVEFDFNLFKK